MIRPEVAFAHDISSILDEDELSIRETRGEPGTEPCIALCVRGVPLFHYRRDEFLDALYVLGLDVLEDLERTGRPLTVGPAASRGPIQ